MSNKDLLQEAEARYRRGERPNLPAIPGEEAGRVRIPLGDPRYCWNPFPHDIHLFRYTLDDGTHGDYLCQPGHSMTGPYRLVRAT